jgi:hypothetical protein
MSQRLDPTQGELRHPLTGEILEPIGYLPNGKAIWPIMGASESAPEDGTEEDETSEETPEEDSTGSEPDDSKEQRSEEKPISAEEFEALKRRMQAADRRATAAEEKVREFQDKDKTELQRVTDRVSELEESLGAKDELIKTLQLQNGFLAANKYTWHDPELALKQVDMDSVEFDADGKPSKESLAKALKSVADKHPYLVKRTESDVTPSGEPGPKKARNAEKDAATRRAEIKKRFPNSIR